MMEVLKIKSIRFKVTFWFVVIIGIGSTLFNFVNYLSTKAQRVNDLNTLAKFTSVRLSKNFAVPIWDMEFELLNNTIRFEMGERQIYSILVTDAEGENIMAGAKRDDEWNVVSADSIVEGNYIEMNEPISKDGEKLGFVKVYFSTRFMDQELLVNLIAFFGSFLVLVVVLVVALYILLGRMVIRPVNEVVELTEKLNEGELSARLQAGDNEIGRMVSAINGFAENLQIAIKDINLSMKAVANGDLQKFIEIDLKGDLNDLKSSINDSIALLGQTIFEVVKASEKVQTGSGEISSSSSTLAGGTSQQAAAIEEMTSSLNEFSSQTKANNDNASQAQQLSNETLEIVQKGNIQMESMLKSINEINNTSSEVSKVIKVIDEIAFQTNLLALNAAVEAARAGKYGKGFAVVADEVRSLASRSAEAAKDTTAMIEASISEVDKGVKNADLTAAVLNEISASIDKTNDLVGEISSASKEQATGIDEINRGLNQINEIVQQNSSISEETASSSEELSAQATQLQKLMGGFQLSRQLAAPVELTENEDNPKVEVTSVSEPKVIPKKESPALDYKPEVKQEGTKKRNVLILDDDDFGKY